MNAALRLCGVEAELPRLMEFAEKFAGRCGLPGSERARLLIILEELFTNALHYGYPHGAAQAQIKVALTAQPGRIEIDFSDDGRPFDPLYHEAVSVRHDPSQPDQVILETFQRGYRRGDVVFRPAKVVVNDLRQGEDGSGPR